MNAAHAALLAEFGLLPQPGRRPRLRGGKARHTAAPQTRRRRAVFRRPWDRKARNGKGGWRDFIRAASGRSGVYIIKPDGEDPYVGSSDGGRLYRTMLRHLQEWGRDKDFWKGYNRAGEKPGLTWDRRKVKVAVILCPADEAHALEAEWMRRFARVQNEAAPPGHAEEVPATVAEPTDEVPF